MKNEKLLQKQQTELTEILNVFPYNTYIQDKLLTVQNELELINNEETKGAIVRSRALWNEYGEKNSKYFLNLEKRNFKDKCIIKLQNDSGEFIYDHHAILQEEKNFFRKLFTSSNPSKLESYESYNAFFRSENIPKLSETAKNKCDNVISLAECAQALKDMKNGKSPGTDGFGCEWYTFCWPDIKHLVHESICYAYHNGRLSIDQCRGIITLTPKPGKDRSLLKNWRPISLLNTDYKIIAKILAGRLKLSLPKLIHPDQTGFIKGRYIGENCRLVADMLHLASIKKITGFLLLIDFQKAFDSVEWNYIDKILPLFNIGDSFRTWVKILYGNSKSTVINNGYASEFFELQRSVRQGCPLAAFIFLLVVEILAICIRKSRNIRGLQIGNEIIKISQFADDTTCFISNEQSIINLFDILKLFYHCSGLKCNVEKTEIILLNKRWNPEFGELPVIPNNNNFKCLGITFTKTEIDTANQNLNLKKDQFSKTLTIWKMRDLSIIGRNTILKSLAIPKIIYPLTSLYVPQDLTNQIQKEIMDYTWYNKTPKVKRSVMYQPIQNGGLKITDFALQCISIKLSWIKRILNTDNKSKFKSTLQYMIPDMSITDLFSSRAYINNNKYKLPLFYQQLIQYWNQFRRLFTPSTIAEIRMEYIWMNENITSETKPLFSKQMYDAGIKYISNIVDRDGNFLTPAAIRNNYNIDIPFLFYYKIRMALPNSWKQALKANQQINPIPYNAPLRFPVNKIPKSIHEITSADFYQILVRNTHKDTPVVNIKWQNMFGNELDFKKIYSLVKLTTKSTKLQAFQFSLLHQYVPHNLRLHTMKIKESPNCQDCNLIDTIIHRFYYCPDIYTFWQRIAYLLNNTYHIDIDLNPETILFGLTAKPKDPVTKIINVCTIVGKYHIHLSRIKQQIPSLKVYIHFLRKTIQNEEYIHIQNNCHTQFINTWGRLKELIQNNI